MSEVVELADLFLTVSAVNHEHNRHYKQMLHCKTIVSTDLLISWMSVYLQTCQIQKLTTFPHLINRNIIWLQLCFLQNIISRRQDWHNRNPMLLVIPTFLFILWLTKMAKKTIDSNHTNSIFVGITDIHTDGQFWCSHVPLKMSV